MSPYLNEPFESPTKEVLRVLNLAWEDRKVLFFIALWPIALPLIATVVSSLLISQTPDTSIAMIIGLLSALVTIYALTLTEVRVYRFVALGEGRGAEQVAPLSLDPRLLTFTQYKLLLSLPSMIIPLVFGISAETVLFMVAYHLLVLRLTFLFTAISLDTPPSFKNAWTQIAPVFLQLLLVEFVFIGVVMLCAMPLVSVFAIALGENALRAVLFIATPLRIIFTQLLAIVDMRFYGRAVLNNGRS